MKAIGFKQSLPISASDSFFEFETEKPRPQDYDLLVKIEAISVNPIDYKIRRTAAKDTVLKSPRIIGWDAVGRVEAKGEKVKHFNIGDAVFYAGDIGRSGSNAEYQLVDERIVGLAPKTLTVARAAALPLTGLTAWECLFDRIKINPKTDRGKTVLILAGAGGVGSIATQLAKKVAGLKVISTASRPESQAWCKKMGADYVVNHNNLKAELKKIGHSEVNYILDFVDLEGYWELATEIIKPQGHIVSITGSNRLLDVTLLKNKSITFSMESMYTRSKFATDDMVEQHHILNRISALIDEKTLQTTLNTTLHKFTVENLKIAHAMQESGKTIGKTVIEF